MRSPPMAGAPGHVLARERSRLRCPNVDRIRRRFRFFSPGCWYSGAIRGAGGQRVFLPFAPPALRPSSWCSVEQNQPHLWQGLVPIHAEPAYGLERPAIYLQGKDPVYGAQMLIVYAAVSVLPAPLPVQRNHTRCWRAARVPSLCSACPAPSSAWCSV